MGMVFVAQHDGSYFQREGVLRVVPGGVVVLSASGELEAAFDAPLIARCGYLTETLVVLPRAEGA